MALPKPLRRALTVWRIQAPTDRPVKVRLVDADLETWGTCAQGPKFYTICLDRQFCQDYAEYAVVLLGHEYAHCLTWDPNADDHSPEFWLAVGFLWRIWTLEH